MKGYIFILMSDPEMCLQSDVEHVKDRPLTGQLGDGGHCQGQVVHQV